MIHYFMCLIRDFIKNRKILIFAILFTILFWLLKALGFLPEDQSWYILVSGNLIAINYTMYFLSLKKVFIVKIIYSLAIISIAILMGFACLDILELIELPLFLIK